MPHGLSLQPNLAAAQAGPLTWHAPRVRFGGRVLVYVIVGALFAFDLAWCVLTGLSVGGWSRAIAGVGALLVVAVAYRRRSRSIAAMAEAAALWIAFTAAGCVLTYLCQTLAFPLHDAGLTAFDTAIGFDWRGVRSAVLARPALHVLLTLAYAGLMPQMVLASVYFPLVGRPERGIELLLLAALSLLPTALISALFPALGPFAAAGGAPGYLPHVLALRGAGPWNFSLMDMEGVITMPSYHLVLAVLFTYAFRGTGVVGWGIAALNVLLALAIAPIGGHYLVDMCAGAPIAVACILGTRRWFRAVSRIPDAATPY